MNARINVRLQPHAGRDELVAIREGVLVVRVAAPALDGRANRSLCKLLAKRLGLPATQVTIVRGAHSRDKVVAVDGIDQDAVESLLAR